MCKLKSCIVLKDRIFCPDYNSHDKMLSDLKIKDTRENAEILFVRVELSPMDGDVFSPVNTWRMKVDQDILPDWWVAEAEEPRVREAVAEWAKDHIFCDAKNLVLKNGTYYLKNSSAELRENSSAELWGNSRAVLWENSRATLWGNSRAELRENSRAALWENSRVTLRENSRAELWGNSRAVLWENSRATLRENSRATLRENSRADLWGNSRATLCENSMGIIPKSISSGKYKNYVLRDNAILKDYNQKTIYQAGGWRVVEA